jgi:hypothetical protein
MSIGTLERAVELIESNMQKCLATYCTITNDSISTIKESCNNRLKFSRALEDTWIPRLDNENYTDNNTSSPENETSNIEALNIQQFKTLERFTDIRRLLVIYN